MPYRTLIAWAIDLCFAFALFVALIGCNSVVSVRSINNRCRIPSRIEANHY